MRTKAIGIAMAVIMLASVMVAIVPTGSAENRNRGDYGEITDVKGTTNKVIIGETLRFIGTNFTGTQPIIGKSPEAVEGKLYGTATATDYKTADYFTVEGTYYVDIGTSGYNATEDILLSVETPRATLGLKATEAGVSKTVSRITQGTPLITEFTTNLFDDDRVDLIIIGPDGRMHDDSQYRTPAQPFDNRSVSELKANYGNKDVGINTTNWKVGTYTFQIKTKSERARGLSSETTIQSLSIGKPEIDITADKTSVIELGLVKLTVTGRVGDLIQISGPKGDTHVIFPSGMEDNKAYETDTGKMINLTIDADGVRTFAVKFSATGSYTIKVTDWTTDATDTVDITVSEKNVVFDIPSTIVIGQKFTLKGTANTGTTVDIFVDDKIIRNDLVLSDGVFSEEVTAASNIGMGTTGTVRLKAIIDRTSPGDFGTVAGETSDGDAVILLTTPGLTAKLSTNVVALEDDFTVSGTAKGSKTVDILSLAPKGGGGTGINGVTGSGLDSWSTSVSETDFTFSKKITVASGADTGTYLVGVLSLGMDGVYGTTSETDIIDAIDARFSNPDLATKTQDQIKAMLVDLTSAVGSDDLIWVGYLKVETGKVELSKPIKAVAVGEPLVINGTTNRKAGQPIVITVKGPKELAPTTALVTNGTFSATIDTTGAPVGTYTVKADDGDGHTDEATVQIVTAVPTVTPVVSPTPTPVVSPTPVPTPVVSPTPTVSPAVSPTPKPPGFEAVFAIAGLLAVAYLVLRRK